MTHEKSHLPNWTGLLSWSTRFHDGTKTSQFGPMDQERRTWLEKALNSAFNGQQDPNEVMKKAVIEIQNGNVSSGLDMLDHVSDFPDCAENIEILGALREIILLIRSQDPKVVIRSLEVLGLYLPNNPKIQLAAALKHNCLDALKWCIQEHLNESAVVHGCISAIGALVRNVAPLENSFIREGGVRYLQQLVVESSDKVATRRVCSILSSLVQRHDLKTSKDDIEELVAHVYGEAGFPNDEIQFWETAAFLATSIQLSDSTHSLVKARESWIRSLTPVAQEDFSSELDALVRI